MMSLIRELPEWASGLLTAAAIWLAIVYTTLTPRVVEAEIKNNLMPQCVRQLEQEQSSFLRRLTRERKDERGQKIEQAKRHIRIQAQELKKMHAAREAYDLLKKVYDDSGLSALIPVPTAGFPTDEEIANIKQDIQSAKVFLQSLPPISVPSAPRGELVKLCSCAALSNMASKRTDFTISLASFRMITPEGLSNTRQEISQTMNWKGCGQKPWKQHEESYA